MPTQVFQFYERIQTVFWMTRFILIHRQTKRRVSPAPSTQSEVLLSFIWFLLLITIWFSKEYWISYSWIFVCQSYLQCVCGLTTNDYYMSSYQWSLGLQPKFKISQPKFKIYIPNIRHEEEGTDRPQISPIQIWVGIQRWRWNRFQHPSHVKT